MKKFLRGSSSRSSKEKQKEEEQKPKFNLPRTAEDRPCEWPSENFMNQVGIKEEFSTYLSNTGLEDFEADKCPSIAHARFSPKTVSTAPKNRCHIHARAERT